jgi:hypothetical protein
MIESYYILQSKLNARIAHLAVEGNNIRVEDYEYIRLSSKPRGRQPKRKLQSSNERILIY